METTTISKTERAAQKDQSTLPQQRWLLLGTLLIGVTFSWMWPASVGAWSYGLFWLVALGIYLAFSWRSVWKNRYALLLLGGTLVILIRYFFGREDGFDVFHIFLLPSLLMLLLVFVQEDPAPQREGVLIPAYFSGWFLKPFSAIGKAFSAAASLGGGKKRIMPVVIGILVGVPLMGLVTVLLMYADAGMEALVDNLFGEMRFGSFFGHLVRTLIVALLFYSVYYNALWGERRRHAERKAANWPASTLGIVTCMLLIVYAAYAVVQFQYLFGAQLPAEQTYSAYAREGFWQLIMVSCINFALFGLAERYTVKTAAGTVLQVLLLVSTALLLGSAMMRMLLYIGVYGLTMKRVLTLWCMLYLALLLVLCAVRLKRTGMPLLRIAAGSLLYWYAALTLVPWERVIESYNVFM